MKGPREQPREPLENREDAAEERDQAADERDVAADLRDKVAERSEARENKARSTTAFSPAAVARREAASDRMHASRDRDASALERERSERSTNGGTSPPFVDAAVQLGLLGSFSLRINAEPLRLPMNAQRLVCFLALEEGMLLRQHVSGSLWGDTSERRSAGSLRSALWRLGHPTHPLVEVADTHLRLSPIVAVDVRASEALARRVLDDSEELSEADMDGALLSSDLLPDWTEDWVLIKREYHTQLRLRALETLCRRLSEMERFGQAVQAGMQAVAGEPLRESAQRALIAAHIAEGNLSAAIQQYDSFRELLRDALDLEPSPEMQVLVRGLNR